MDYIFTEEDYEKAFDFGVRYYLDPSKGKTGRTTAEPRGFGGTLDAFTAGKLIEIGVKKLIETNCKGKEVKLDFLIKNTKDIAEEADIIGIEENNKERDPKCFIEIKRTKNTDRWIGVTKEQLSSIKQGKGKNEAYFIHASLVFPTTNNYKTTDVVGVFLKYATKHEMFKDFIDLDLKMKLEFIFSEKELNKYGIDFPKGEITYETIQSQESNTSSFLKRTSIQKVDGTLKKDIKKKKKQNINKIYLPNLNGTIDRKYGEFVIKGKYQIYEKKNKKSTREYIKCITDVTIENKTFGKYKLERDKAYTFNLETLGRDPVLKRNNVFMAKRQVYALINKGNLKRSEDYIKEIAQKI